MLNSRVLWLSGASLFVTTSCIPVIDLDEDDRVPTPARQLAVAVIQPASDREVPLGTLITIEWSTANLTGDEGVGTVFLRSREDLSETILQGGILITESRTSQSLSWDTAAFADGRYDVIVRVSAGGFDADATSAGEITVNSPPSFSFTEPVSDTTLAPDPDEPDGPDEVTIRWTASDPNADASLELFVDPDSDHDSGNEITLVERVVTDSAGVDSFTWDATDETDERVDAGTYFLVARISDDINPEQVIESAARLIVPAEPEPVVLAITAPEDDVEFLVGADPLAITFTYDEDEDALIDIKLDTDDSNTSGNERTILSQRLADADENEDTFDWDGTDSDGAAVPDGLYRVFLVLNRGSGTPQTVQGEGLVQRRSFAEQPLIGLLTPAVDQTVTPGAFVTIQWRDDDPEADSEVRLVIDDDNMPNEAVETGAAEIVILSGREADPDGVQDTFAYQIPASLAPGAYFIFATADRDSAAPFDHTSTASGRVIVDDPLN